MDRKTLIAITLVSSISATIGLVVGGAAIELTYRYTDSEKEEVIGAFSERILELSRTCKEVDAVSISSRLDLNVSLYDSIVSGEINKSYKELKDVIYKQIEFELPEAEKALHSFRHPEHRRFLEEDIRRAKEIIDENS